MPPPLRLSVKVDTPSGRAYRWASDETDAANIPDGLRFSSTMPGGFESCDMTLPRQPGVEYADLERLSNVTVIGAGGDVAWDGRLERVPRSAGSESSVSPSAVGHQAALDDDKTIKFIAVDRDLSAWGGQSVQRQRDLADSGFAGSDGSVTSDVTTGEPSMQLEATSPWTLGAPGAPSGSPTVEAWYDAQGLSISSLYYAWKKSPLSVSPADTNWQWSAVLLPNDVVVGVDYDWSGNLRSAGPGTGTVTASSLTRRYGIVQFIHSGSINGTAFDGWNFDVWWTCLAVYGDHGMTKRGTNSATDAQGFYASDIVRHVVPRFAPTLRVTAESVGQSGFVFPHFSFREPTTCAELVRAASRVGLQDWGVWEGRVFWWQQPGVGGRKWRSRLRPAQLEETGPQVDRLWNGVVVQYQDVDGSTRTVGPPGSGATVVDSHLLDSDTENPANRLGIRRWDLLQLSGTSTAATAVSAGQVFLSQSKLLDSSGQANLVGHVEDDHGVLHPAWRVRAGDHITFVDAPDRSPRKVVRADYSHDSRTCSVDLDAPPEGLDALLERLGAVLQPLGLS